MFCLFPNFQPFSILNKIYIEIYFTYVSQLEHQNVHLKIKNRKVVVPTYGKGKHGFAAGMSIVSIYVSGSKGSTLDDSGSDSFFLFSIKKPQPPLRE